MNYKKIIYYYFVFNIIISYIYSNIQIKKYRTFYFYGQYRHNFINQEGKNAFSIINFFNNGTFEYEEYAAGGTTIFSGNYDLDKNVIKFINDNGYLREFEFLLKEDSLTLKSINIVDKIAYKFHIQPTRINQTIEYKKINFKPLDFSKSEKINFSFIYKNRNENFIFTFKEDNKVEYKIKIENDIETIIEGKYFIKDNILVIEDNYFIRFKFYILIKNNYIILKLKSNNYLEPFKKQKELKFIKL